MLYSLLFLYLNVTGFNNTILSNCGGNKGTISVLVSSLDVSINVVALTVPVTVNVVPLAPTLKKLTLCNVVRPVVFTK